MSKKSLATVWLDGCSGCHMSFLDMDERILQLLEKADLVYSPLVDVKTYPEMVDIALVEGAIGNIEDFHKIRHIREHTRILVSLGDCAVTSNVPGMRNPFKKADLLNRAYFENATTNRQIPDKVIPQILDREMPVHEAVKVDVFIPGCPPHADTIFQAVMDLLDGKTPDLSTRTRFGA
ncbi:MAG: NADP oxidoreductase [Calditrichia bacterium]